MLYFGKEFSATRSTEIFGEFRCSFCEFTSRVQIIGIGHGKGVAPYLLDQAGAAERARRAASASARSNAAVLEELSVCARCPKCRKVDARGFRRFWIRGLVMTVVGMGVFGLLAAGLVDAGSPEAAVWIAVLGSSFSVALVGWILLDQWVSIQRRISFIKPTEAPPPPKKKRRSKRPEVASAEESPSD